MSDQFRWETFQQQMDGIFKIHGEFGTIETTLVDCKKLSGPPTNNRDPFSIVLHGPSEPLIEQNTYKVENDAMGAMEIFLVPLGPDSTGMKYEAVFT